jgi:hypothetical protein
LRSDTIELRELEGREVRVTGSVMEGHPPPKEGDPKLLEVFAITPIEQE